MKSMVGWEEGLVVVVVVGFPVFVLMLLKGCVVWFWSFVFQGGWDLSFLYTHSFGPGLVHCCGTGIVKSLVLEARLLPWWTVLCWTLRENMVRVYLKS